MDKMDKFQELDETTKETFMRVFEKKAFPMAMRFQFIGNVKQKELVKLTKLPDHYAFILDKELMVSFNENLLDAFDDDESVDILIETELDKITIDPKSGKIKLVKPDLTTFAGIINNYGIESVARANQISDLYDQQQKDGQVDLV